MKNQLFSSLVIIFIFNIATAQNPCPNFEWAVRGISSTGSGQAIAIDNQGNSYTMITDNQESLRVEKIDTYGESLWNTSASIADFRGGGIAVDIEGNSYITGSFVGTVSFGNTVLTSLGGSDIFIAKLSPNGQFLWAINIGAENSSNTESGHDIAVDANGNCYITGRFSGSAMFGNTVLYANNYDYTYLFVTKLNTNGQFIWAKSRTLPYTSSIGEIPKFKITIDYQGNSYVTGWGGSHQKMIITKFNINGDVLWEISPAQPTSTSTPPSVISYGIAADVMGNCYVTGFVYDSAVFGAVTVPDTTVFISKLNPDGIFLWTSTASHLCRTRGIAVDSFGNSYVTGEFSWSPTLGNITLQTNGYQDAFIAKLNPDGQIIEAVQAGGDNYDYGFAVAVDDFENVYAAGMSFSNPSTFGNVVIADNSSPSFITKLNWCNSLNTISINSSDISIFPNPSKISFTITGAPIGATLFIIDLAGKVVYNEPVLSEQIVLETTSFTNGVYLVNIEYNSNRLVQKLVINK
jgi:hypothetical protein